MIPKSMRPLLPYLKRYRWGFVAGIFCILLSNGAWVLLPQVIRHAVDDLNMGVTSAKLLHFALQSLDLLRKAFDHSGELVNSRIATVAALLGIFLRRFG